MYLLSNPIHTTQRLYKHVIHVTVKKSRQWYEVEKYDFAIELLKSIIPLSQFALELFDTLMLYKLVATIEFDRKEFQNALNICHLMIYVCGINDQL